MTSTCPFCGQQTNIPILFTRKRQMIFHYIWENPYCTQTEISAIVYGNPTLFNRVSAHVGSIGRCLGRSNEYELIVDKSKSYPWRYKIIKCRRGPESERECDNGTDQLDPSVS